MMIARTLQIVSSGEYRGHYLMTSGVAALSAEVIEEAKRTILPFDVAMSVAGNMEEALKTDGPGQQCVVQIVTNSEPVARMFMGLAVPADLETIATVTAEPVSADAVASA